MSTLHKNMKKTPSQMPMFVATEFTALIKPFEVPQEVGKISS